MSTLPGTTGRRRIYLMRHGHVDYLTPEINRTRNTRDVVLTAKGCLQANAAAHAFANVVLDRAICSGLPRTRETAEIVLAGLAHAPALEIEPRLEEIHGGHIDTKDRIILISAMAFQFARAADEGATLFDGGEAFARAQARAIAAFEQVLGEPDWRQILIVAHEGINRLLLSWAAGAGLSAAPAFEQDTGCINVVDFDMVPAENGRPGPKIERALIKAVNLTPYNYLKHGMNLTSLEAIFTEDDTETPKD